MTPLRWVACGIALGLLALSLAGCSAGPAPRSVVLVVIDTLRSDHLSLNGYPRPTSPGLDRIAAEGVAFEHCLAPGAWTKPNTVSLLSGLDPIRHGAHRERKIPDDLQLLSETLRDAGYDTAAFSGNPYVSERYRFDRGFATFYDGGAGKRVWDYPDASVLLDAARGWLARPRERPVFLYLHLMNVHGPYRAPEPYRRRFLDGTDGDESFEFQDELWWAIIKAEDNPAPRPTPGQRADLLARYDGAIAYTDELLTAFLDELRAEAGLADALLVVTSDHGEELLDHGNLGHRKTLYHEVVDVPLIVRDGVSRGGRRVRTPVGLIDVAATILDLLGLVPAGAGLGDGISLAPLVRGDGEISRSEPLLSHLDEAIERRASLVQRWPLRRLHIGPSRRRDVVELYDELADPLETHDLAAERPELVVELGELERAAHERLRARALDPGADAMIDPELQKRLEALGYVGN